MQLQRSSNGRTWSTVRNWSSSGTGSALLDKIYYVSPGYDYRLHVTATVITPELEHRKSGYVERKRRPYQGNVARIA